MIKCKVIRLLGYENEREVFINKTIESLGEIELLQVQATDGFIYIFYKTLDI